MPRTGSVERERIVAWVAVLGVHLLFWWMLARATTITMSSGDTSEALQVTWIAPSPPPQPAATAIAPSPPPPSARARDRKSDPQATPPTGVVQEQTPAPVAPMSAVFIEQARHLPGARDQGDVFMRDPLANHHARLPGTQADAFRMREPLSPQRVLRRIGALLGGSEYTTDPCPRIRENIAGLAPGGDGDLLQEELRRQRAYCH